MPRSRLERIAVAVCYAFSAACVVFITHCLFFSSPPPKDPNDSIITGSMPLPEPWSWFVANRPTDPEVAQVSDQLGVTNPATAQATANLKLPHNLTPIAVRLNGAGTPTAALAGPTDPQSLPNAWTAAGWTATSIDARTSALTRNGTTAVAWTIPAREPNLAYLLITFTPSGALSR